MTGKSIKNLAITFLIVAITITIALSLKAVMQSTPSGKSNQPAGPARRRIESTNSEPKWKFEQYRTTRFAVSTYRVSDADFADILDMKGVGGIKILHSRGVTGEGLHRLKDVPLKYINIHSPNLTDEGMIAIASIKTLNNVSITATSKISARGFAGLAALPGLTTLHVRDMQLPEGAYQAIGKLSSLERLSLHQVSPLTGEGIKSLNKLKQLAVLNLSKTRINDVNLVLREIARLPHLTNLNLRWTPVTDDQVHILLDSKIETIDITVTRISETGLSTLAKLDTLKTLRAANPMITRSAVNRFKKQRPDCDLQLETLSAGEIIHLKGTEVIDQ